MSYLEERIDELETTQARQIEEMKMSAKGIVNSLLPSNLLKNAVSTVVHSPNLRDMAIKTAVGLGVGFIGKKLFRKKSK